MGRLQELLKPDFWLHFGKRYTHPGEGLYQISHFIPEVNDFTQILALASLLRFFFEDLCLEIPDMLSQFNFKTNIYSILQYF